MDTDSFVVHIETEDFYKDISNDVEKWFDTSNCEHNRPLPKGLNKKVLGKMKNELGGRIIKEFITLKPKTYSYITDDEDVCKKAKGTNRATIKNNITHNDYYDCLFNKSILLCEQKRRRSYKHNAYTESVNKIALNYTDDKRRQTFDGIHSYHYGINPYIPCKEESRHKYKILK